MALFKVKFLLMVFMAFVSTARCENKEPEKEWETIDVGQRSTLDDPGNTAAAPLIGPIAHKVFVELVKEKAEQVRLHVSNKFKQIKDKIRERRRQSFPKTTPSNRNTSSQSPPTFTYPLSSSSTPSEVLVSPTPTESSRDPSEVVFPRSTTEHQQSEPIDPRGGSKE